MNEATIRDLEPLSYFFGAWLGDGWISVNPSRNRYSTGIACSDSEIVERCCWIVRNYFSDLRAPSLDSWKTTNVVMYRARWHSSEFVDLIYNAMGFKERLPNYIFLASKEAQLEMLAGLMDTDGSIGKGTGRKDRPYYNLTFWSTKPFVREVYLLFDLVGMKVGKWYLTLPRGKATLAKLGFSINLDSAIEAGFYFHCVRKMSRLNGYAKLRRRYKT